MTADPEQLLQRLEVIAWSTSQPGEEVDTMNATVASLSDPAYGVCVADQMH